MKDNSFEPLASTMAMVVLPQSAWEDVTSDLKEMKDFLKGKSEDANEWIEGNQARKMLGVSSKTWQSYRDKRIIPFAQFGRKIMVKKADIEAFMEEHYISKKGGAI